jgi:hypothetical protein
VLKWTNQWKRRAVCAALAAAVLAVPACSASPVAPSMPQVERLPPTDGGHAIGNVPELTRNTPSASTGAANGDRRSHVGRPAVRLPVRQ